MTLPIVIRHESVPNVAVPSSSIPIRRTREATPVLTDIPTKARSLYFNKASSTLSDKSRRRHVALQDAEPHEARG